MSATNLTKNLKLPQFLASDKPSWLGDVNGAMLNIDNGYGKMSGDISKANDTASSAKSQSDANTQTLVNVNSELESQGNRITALEAGGGTEQLEQRVGTLETDVEALQTRADTFEEEIAENGKSITALNGKVTALETTTKTNSDNITSLQTTTEGLTLSTQAIGETANTAKTTANTANTTAGQALTLASTANNTSNANASSISSINSRLERLNVLSVSNLSNTSSTRSVGVCSDLLAIQNGDNSFILNFGVNIISNTTLNSTGILVGTYNFSVITEKTNAIFNNATLYDRNGIVYQLKATFSNGTLNVYLASEGGYTSNIGSNYTINSQITFY